MVQQGLRKGELAGAAARWRLSVLIALWAKRISLMVKKVTVLLTNHISKYSLENKQVKIIDIMTELEAGRQVARG